MSKNLKISDIKSQRVVAHGFRYLLLASTIAVFLLIVIGGLVRVTESGGACMDWPTCFGYWTPPEGGNALIDYFHRFLTFIASVLILLATFVARRHYSDKHLISRPLYFASSTLTVQILLGAILSEQFQGNLRATVSMIHLCLSLLMQTSLLIATVVAFFEQEGSRSVTQLKYHSSFAQLSLINLGMVLILFISGAIVTVTRASTACGGWPFCDGSLIPGSMAGLINMIHRLIVLSAAGMLVALLLRAWRTQRARITILVTTTATVVLFFAQALMGSKMADSSPVYLLGLHTATAVALWVSLSIQVVSVAVLGHCEEEEDTSIAPMKGKDIAKDFLLLTKPVVVALLLVTTYAGMVIGGKAWPSIPISIWTLVGGFLAAGGSGAINQYIDRYDDGKMQRTQKRPIPSGRLTPAEGLAFGVAMTLISFFIFVAFVNLLAALLTLTGIVYYVVLYSILLKKTTIQNIVIGGGAGAIPPLVGWAAATGSLNIPSLFLFAVVFMWTPPHFWALAIVRQKDYARAGVPMLPVIRGENETRWQIFIYTLALVGLTLFLPFFGLGGSVYIIGAALLGVWLVVSAWKVWKVEGNKVAWKMYRYSSMYLAFLFVVLMIDALI